MQTYHLSSSQSDRINYDDANRRYIEEELQSVRNAGGDLTRISYELFFDLDGMESERVDDMEEAEARFASTFDTVLNEMLAETN